ncbi:MAG TPA: metallophosphoesterase [Candidatus Dormibacteraeota bacterium]|nr:metallophosphoesterase [Candidatus Dormibacteraeota bacterium]
MPTVIYPPTFAELYVISDIHMGGRKSGDADFQIFNRGQRLGSFIQHIAAQRPQEDVALVLNGDIIDSLAENEVPGYVALDAGTAETMMQHLYTDASFAMVWEALAAFVRAPHRHLVFVVGNHDIELSLPTVEASIRQRLAGDDLAAQSRLVFATHGGGFACYVGSARVFCTHGNEVDAWNWVDYTLLGQLANAINGGRTADRNKWKPNAGTRLVIDVMNTIKRRYPFVDLLKPEVAAMAGVLVALDRDICKGVDFGDVFPIVRDKVAGGLVVKNLLGAPDASLAAVPPHALADEVTQQLLGPSFRAAVRAARPIQVEDELLLSAGAAVRAGPSASDTYAAGAPPETLGWWDVFAARVGLVDPVEGLRRALKDWIKDDKTYAVDNPDDELYQQMQDRVGDGVDYVVTGHTHLARALLTRRNRFYYNSGTWIRLLSLTDEALADTKTFADQVWRVLSSGRMGDLDTAMIPGKDGSMQNLLFDRTNAVRIRTEQGRVIGELLRVSDVAQNLTLQPEPNTTPFTLG